jgi:hypothetical protein
VQEAGHRAVPFTRRGALGPVAFGPVAFGPVAFGAVALGAGPVLGFALGLRLRRPRIAGRTVTPAAGRASLARIAAGLADAMPRTGLDRIGGAPVIAAISLAAP